MEKNDSKGEAKIVPPPLLFSTRLTFFIMVLFVMMTAILQRLNMNFALVCMVKSITPNHTDILEHITDIDISSSNLESISSIDLKEISDEIECKPISNSLNDTKRFEGEFEWDKPTQANILGSFFYGFLLTQILGGWLSDKFGGKKLYIGSILILSVLTLLNPTAAIYGPQYLFAVRLIMGLSHGAVLPLINVLAVRWAGSTERAFLLSIGYFGFSIAGFITYPICALICERLGWSYIFYITGGVGIVWCILAQFLIYDWPEDHPRISTAELDYLKKTAISQKDLNHSNQKLRIPWKRIVFSWPINVVHITHFCAVWGLITVGISFPQFLKEVLYMDVGKNGLYSALPFLGMLIFHMGVGIAFDHLRYKNIWSVTTLRKMFNTTGFIIPAISLCLMSLLSCTNNAPGIIGISFGIATCQFALMGGYFLSIFELAPRFSGILTGITNTVGVVPGFLCPIVIGFITRDGSRESWLNVFYLAAGLYFAGGFIYLLFGSSKLQSWAVPKTRVSKELKIFEDKLLFNKAEAEVDEI